MFDSPVIVIDPSDRGLDPNLRTGYKLSSRNSVSSLSTGLVCIEFRGCGVIAGSLCNTPQDAQAVLNNFSTRPDLVKAVGDAVGSFTLVIYDATDASIYYLNDPLGGGMIFRYGAANAAAVSADITSLRGCLEDHRLPLNRNLLYEISGFATGSQCHGGDTPFYEIHVEPPGSGLMITREGIIHRLDYCINDFMYSGGKGASFDELLDAGTERITQSLTAAISDGSHLVLSDITGGFDSRLVLSAIMASGLNSEVVLRSIPNSAEWDYATGLAKLCGMQIAEDDGFDKVWETSSDLYESCVSGARASGGLINNDMARYAAPSPGIRFQGGYGEVFRTFNTWHYADDGFSSKVLSEHIWAWSNLYRLRVQDTPLFNSDFLCGILSERMEEVTERAEKFNISAPNMSSFWYQQGRNRYWIGQQSYHTSRAQAQLDPLYSPELIAAAYGLTFWERKSNLVGLEAMYRFYPRMLEYPFYNKGVLSPMFLAKRPVSELRSFPTGDCSTYRSDRPRRPIPTRDTARDSVHDSDVALASSLGILPTTAAGIRTWSKPAYETIVSSDVLKSVFDGGALSNLLSSPPATRDDARVIESLIGSLFRSGILKPDEVSTFDRLVFS